MVFALLGAAVLGGAATAIVHPTLTSARLSSTAHRQVNKIHAGYWSPDVPAECGNPDKYKGGVRYGTPGDDVIHAGNRGEIVFGLGGDDTLYGGNAKDCLVGGPGDDTLNGGNGKDVLIAGGDSGDVCVGGNGPTTYIGCPSGKRQTQLDVPPTGSATTDHASSQPSKPPPVLPSDRPSVATPSPEPTASTQPSEPSTSAPLPTAGPRDVPSTSAAS